MVSPAMRAGPSDEGTRRPRRAPPPPAGVAGHRRPGGSGGQATLRLFLAANVWKRGRGRCGRKSRFGGVDMAQSAWYNPTNLIQTFAGKIVAVSRGPVPRMDWRNRRADRRHVRARGACVALQQTANIEEVQQPFSKLDDTETIVSLFPRYFVMHR